MTGSDLVILAGPNGVGKTTFARLNLRLFIGAFLNADDIARDVNPSDVEAVAIDAGRRMLSRRQEFVQRRQSFCLETTLATRTLLRIHQATAVGYRSRLFFLFTPLPHLNELRVAQRVMRGGHNIDIDTIRRRHRSGLELLANYWDAVHEGVVLDARTDQMLEIVRKNATGSDIRNQVSFALLNEAVATAGGRPLA